MKKQKHPETYNGWTNYPTWAVYNWLSNESATYKAMQDVGRTAKTAFAAGQTIRQLVKEKRTHDIEFKAAPPKIMAILAQRAIAFPANSDYDSHFGRRPH